MEDDLGVLWYKGMICVPYVKGLKHRILREAHDSTYSIHPEGIRCTMISRQPIGNIE
jgi:hypothetical protein